jgi:hypothetical protein
LPPAFAARLRVVLLPLDDDRLVLGLRALDVERRLEEDDEPEVLRLRPPDPPALDFLVPEELDLRAPDPLVEDLRLLDPLELRELEPRELDARELEPRELDDEPELRAPVLREPELREPDPDDLRPPDPPPEDDDLFRDDPPPLPELDSAIALSSSEAALHRLPARCGRDYMPRAAVT